MKCSSNAFTMIELIFVVVILGILASVAVPKLEQARKEQAIKANSASIADTSENTSEWK